MSNQEQHDLTNRLIDDTINIDDALEYYPEISSTDNNGQLTTISNFYPQNYSNTSMNFPLISDSVIPQNGKLSLQMVDDDDSFNNNKALTRMSSQLPSKLKKTKPKKAPVGPKSRPAFVMKLWTMVNDPSNDQYIKWLPDGKSFIVTNRESFMKFILPKYFKHNNFASFVRQLNMYGWHKVQDVTHESIHSASQQNGHESWQFENPNFIKDKENLLDNIVRNKSSKEDEEVDFGILLSEFENIKMNQLAIVEDLRRLRNDNQLLWEEHFTARERHEKQTQALDKIMRFLHQVYGNGSRIEGANNFTLGDLMQATQGFPNQQLQQQSQPQQLQQQSQQLQSQYNDDSFNKPMLMLMNSAHKRTPSDLSQQQQPSIQEITSPTIDQSQHVPSISESMTTPGSTTTSRSNHHPLVQELLDNDVHSNGENQIAPSPSTLFRELEPTDQLSLTPADSAIKESPHLSTDPNYMDNLILANKSNEEKIQRVDSMLKNYTHGKNVNFEDYLPSDDAGNSFNMEEYLMPTPQDFNLLDAGNTDPLFVTLTPSDLNEDLDLNGKHHVGTIDEIVDEPQVKRKKVRRS